MTKYIYFFGTGKAEGTGQMRDLLGGKGAGLAEMTTAGVPVPPGFTITTEVCRLFYENRKRIPTAVKKEMNRYLKKLEEVMATRLGDPENPLLLSVRSGAKFSMPGMMDTILNLGLNDETVEGLIRKTKDERFSLDCYRRFIQMFGNVVLGVEKFVFEEILKKKKEKRGTLLDIELTPSDLRDLVGQFKEALRYHANRELPQDARAQLEMARDAVFLSWNNDRAIFYRKQYKISHKIGTAVNVQVMVFGNMGKTSGTGVPVRISGAIRWASARTKCRRSGGGSPPGTTSPCRMSMSAPARWKRISSGGAPTNKPRGTTTAGGIKAISPAERQIAAAAIIADACSGPTMRGAATTIAPRTSRPPKLNQHNVRTKSTPT